MDFKYLFSAISFVGQSRHNSSALRSAGKKRVLNLPFSLYSAQVYDVSRHVLAACVRVRMLVLVPPSHNIKISDRTILNLDDQFTNTLYLAFGSPAVYLLASGGISW